MSNSIFYNYFYKTSPPFTEPKNNGSFDEKVRYLFIFNNISELNHENVTIKIAFYNKLKIVKSFSSFSDLTVDYENNCANIGFRHLPSKELVYVNFIVSGSFSDGDIPISCNNEGIELIKSHELSLKANTSDVQPSDKKFHFIIASALHEELSGFTRLNRHLLNLDDEGAIKYFSVSNQYGNIFNVILYSANQMGMPVNGVAITKMVAQYTPEYLIFIGTCGGLKESKELQKGDILIPDYIYDYEAGKYCDNNEHQCEMRPYNLDARIISLTSQMLNQKAEAYPFHIKMPCGLCSGSSVISSRCKRKKIAKKANRKVLGFDMESYVIPIINHFYLDLKAIVIKGIMDFGRNKNDDYKEKAKQNAVIVANDLIKYIVANKGSLN